MYRITRRLVDLDNKMAAVHPQPVQDPLPPGWECRYDPRTGRYYFLNHLEHITTWEDPRLRLSEIQQGSYAKHYLYGTGKPPSGAVKAYPPYSNTTVQYPADVSPPPPPPVPMPAPLPTPVTNGSGGYPNTARFFVQSGYSPHYGSPRTPYRFKQEGSVQVDERILMKLCVQFPTVEEGHIWQLLKQYHNRENVVVSALLAEGSPRAQTHTVDLTPKLQKAEIQSFQVDEALYFKLRNFFPTADPDYIRNLQKVYNNQEHEVIAALVAGNRAGSRQSPHPSSPKMKLRYLKLVFPECDEAVLFDVLNNCDNNAQEASNRLIGMGYSKRDTPITRPNTSQPFHRPVSEIPRPILTPERPPVFILPNASDKLQLVSRLQEQFPAISRTLVNMALDSSNYNEDRAKQFLAAMTPQDGVRPSIPHIDGKDAGTEGSPLIAGFPSEAPPVPPRSRHASASQDSDSSRHSSLERHSLRGESSREATPSKSPSHRGSVESPARSISSPARKVSTTTDRTFRQKFKREILKFSKSTSTQEEYEIISKYRTRPKGPDPTLRKGPCEKLLLKDYMPWVGSDPKNHKGPDLSLRRGPDPSNVGTKREYRAKGPQRDYCRGSLVGIHNSKLSSASTANGNIEVEQSRCS